MKGRKPKPTARKIAEGDARKIGKRKLEAKQQAEPTAFPGLPKCPRHLRGRARAAWNFWVPELEIMSLDKRPDAMMLEGACVNYARAVQADLLIEREGLMEKKGFPESYDLPALLRFLSEIKAGLHPVRAPVYSHLIYDVIPNQQIEIDRPEILIVEGLNVLQAGRLPKDGKAVPFVSDFFDFSVYLDADESVLLSWYVDRFLALRGTAFADPKSYFHRYAQLSDAEAIATATSIWNRINLVNLRENILPTRPRADLILKKGESHEVEEVALRRL